METEAEDSDKAIKKGRVGGLQKLKPEDPQCRAEGPLLGGEGPGPLWWGERRVAWQSHRVCGLAMVHGSVSNKWAGMIQERATLQKFEDEDDSPYRLYCTY